MFEYMAKEQKELTGAEKFKNSLCYIPLVAFILFFTESNKSPELMKHIKYGSLLFIVYAVVYLILGLLPISGLTEIWALIYLGIFAFLAYKAYMGQEIELEYLDKMEEKVKENMK